MTAVLNFQDRQTSVEQVTKNDSCIKNHKQITDITFLITKFPMHLLTISGPCLPFLQWNKFACQVNYFLYRSHESFHNSTSLKNYESCMRLEILRAVKMSMLVFLVVTPSLRGRQHVPPKRWYLPTSPHGVRTQKIDIDNFESFLKSQEIMFLQTYTYKRMHETSAIHRPI
jgi:hypothetical protein